MITLYDIPVSSYGCKIRIVLTHKKLEWQTVPPPDGYGSPAYCAISPAGTIPAIDQDGFVLGDSEAIAEYLEESVQEPAMLPINKRERARAREISRFHDTRIEPVLRAYFPHVAPKRRDPAFVAENAALLQKRIDQLAQMVSPSPLLFGNQLSIADCGFVASFALISIFREILGINVVLPPILKKYEAALTAHESVTKQNTAYYKALNNWANDKLNG